MQYFSITDTLDKHVGFLVMNFDDEEKQQSGQFAIQVVENSQPEQVLLELQQYPHALFWQVDKDRVVLFDAEDKPLGSVRQEWLILSGKQFVLTDLTGTM